MYYIQHLKLFLGHPKLGQKMNFKRLTYIILCQISPSLLTWSNT